MPSSSQSKKLPTRKECFGAGSSGGNFLVPARKLIRSRLKGRCRKAAPLRIPRPLRRKRVKMFRPVRAIKLEVPIWVPLQTVEKPCHCETVRTLSWQSPPDFQTFSFQNRKFLRSTGGFPHQSADWFGMTTYLSDFFDMLWRYPYGCLFFVPMKLLLAVWGIMCYNKPNYAENGYFLQR